MANLTSKINVEAVFRQIPYLQGEDLSADLGRFLQLFEGKTEKCQIPDTNFVYESYYAVSTRAAFSTSTSAFKNAKK